MMKTTLYLLLSLLLIILGVVIFGFPINNSGEEYGIQQAVEDDAGRALDFFN